MAVWTPRSSTGIWMLLAAAKVFGGSEQNMDPVFKKFAEIAPDLRFNRADEMTAMFQQEQIWIGWQNNTRVRQLQVQGFPIEMNRLDEGTPLFTNGVVLLERAPNRENGIKLINFFLSDEGQKLIADALGSGPTVKSVKLDADLAAQVPYGAAVENGFVGDWDAIVANRAKWLDRWTREIER
jgi:putative spermidine/putrescine transport system substrate-binding protein